MIYLQQKTIWRGALGVVVTAGLLAGCGSDSNSPTEEATPPTVRDTATGPVQGVETGYGYAFKGIPYATPPVGDLRFQPPVAPESWQETLVADEFGGSCIQPASTFGTEDSTEDCLYLNVYAPENAEDLPVMVWIHGGSFETGSGNAYNPSDLMGEDVVVVTINYRLGVLGFVPHPDMAAESAGGHAGSYGLMDQQLALQWVQDNIAGFGGSADNVTIFGESAGGLSVLSHVVSPASAGLFHKAIVQSGSYSGQQPSQAEAVAGGEMFYQSAFGCEDLACIRDLGADDILAAQQATDLDFMPTLRDDIMPLSVGDAIASGDYAQVPMIAGTNRDEWRLFVAVGELTRIEALLEANPEMTLEEAAMEAMLKPEDYVGEVESLLDVSTAQAQGIIDNFYPLADGEMPGYDNTSVAVGAIGTDVIFACNALGQIGQLAQRANVYGYEFADRDAPSLIGNNNTFDLGAAHAFEIQYVFGSAESRAAPVSEGGRGMTDEQLQLAEAMTGYWAQFAKTGDPNAETGEGVFWPTVGADSSLLEFKPAAVQTLTTEAFGTRHKCGVWAGS